MIFCQERERCSRFFFTPVAVAAALFRVVFSRKSPAPAGHVV